MADLDFSHNVQQIPAGAELPRPVQRSVTAEATSSPDFQSAINQYAADTNTLSAIGSSIAIKSSNAIAKRLGGELGKEPKGDIGIPLTDFDKVMSESYQTQSQATLGLRANKLMTDSNLELAKAPRITPDLIAKTNNSISLGMQNIFKNAPSEIRPNLEYQYGNMQIAQLSDLTQRMIREQKEDRKANTAYSTEVNSQNAYSLAIRGNYDAAKAAVDSTRRANEADVAAGISDKKLAKTNTDAANISYLSGKYSHGYEVAKANGKGEEYLASLADPKNMPDVSDANYTTVTSNVLNHVRQKQALMQQDNALTVSKINVQIATDPSSITSAQLLEAESKLPATEYNNLYVNYNKALASAANNTNSVADTIKNFSNYEQFPLKSEKAKLGAQIQLAQELSNQSGISLPEAEMQVAAIASGPIPGYVNKLNAKAASGIPTNLNEVGAAIEYMGRSGVPENLGGLTDQTKSLVGIYESLRDSHDETTAAQMAKETVFNSDPKVQKAVDDGYANYITRNKQSGMTNESFALSVADIDPDTLVNVPQLSEFVSNKFRAYYSHTKGDAQVATRLLKNDIDQTFGYTKVNGRSEYAYLPINKVYQLPEDSNGFIHDDLSSFVSNQLKSTKQLYDEGKVDFYWDIKPAVTLEEAKEAKIKHDSTKADTRSLYKMITEKNVPGRLDYLRVLDKFQNSPPPKAYQHFRDGSVQSYELSISASPSLSNSRGKNGQRVAGYYNVNLKTDTGIVPFMLADPRQGPAYYVPNRNKIMEGYMLVNPPQGQRIPKFSPEVRNLLLNITGVKTGINAPVSKEISERVKETKNESGKTFNLIPEKGSS